MSETDQHKPDPVEPLPSEQSPVDEAAAMDADPADTELIEQALAEAERHAEALEEESAAASQQSIEAIDEAIADTDAESIEITTAADDEPAEERSEASVDEVAMNAPDEQTSEADQVDVATVASPVFTPEQAAADEAPEEAPQDVGMDELADQINALFQTPATKESAKDAEPGAIDNNEAPAADGPSAGDVAEVGRSEAEDLSPLQGAVVAPKEVLEHDEISDVDSPPQPQQMSDDSDDAAEALGSALAGQSRGPTLRELDEALADDVEHLLDSEFDAVSDVLNNVFDQHAAIVQENEEDIGFIPAQVYDDVGQPGATPRQPASRAASPPASPDGDDESIPDTETDKEAALIEGGTFETVDEVVSKSQQPTQGEPQTVSQPATEDAGDSELLPPRTEPEPEPVAPVAATEQVASRPDDAEATVPAVPREEPASVEPVGEPVEAEPKIAMLVRIEPHIVAVLRGMNYPLRFVPAKARPIVDWLALSLVFWVPIVWIMALFVIGR